MQVTSLRTLEEDAKKDDACADCGHDHGGLDHSHTNTKLSTTIVGLIFVLNSFAVDWLFERGTTVAAFRAMIGVIILGPPITVPYTPLTLPNNSEVHISAGGGTQKHKSHEVRAGR